MNDNAKLWVEDLINGPQAQAIGRLRDDDGGRCCLGVGCDTYMRVTGLGHWDKRNIFYEDSLDTGSAVWCSSAETPTGVQEWLGLHGPEGDFNDPSEVLGLHQGCLTDLNDNEGLTLKEIGEFIRDHGDEVGLFV